MSNIRTHNLLLKGGRLLCPASGLDQIGDLLIKDSQIIRVGKNLSLNDGEIIDCFGLVIAPGLIDLHVHLREPGQEYKETICSGTAAAAAGGFTTVCTMPNTEPVNDNKAVTSFILENNKRSNFCRVYPIGAITQGLKGQFLTEIADLKESGCIAISDDSKPVSNAQLMRRALEYANSFDIPVICHSEEIFLSAGGVMHEGPLSTRLGLRGIPAEAEVIAVKRDLSLAMLTGARIHIAHVSCADSLVAICQAKEAGVRVTCETAPHYLVLTDNDVGYYNTYRKINPPLRTMTDREALRRGLTEGLVDVIASDHAPHSSLEKEVEFSQAAFGVVGLETCLGIMLKLVEEGVLSLSNVIYRMSYAPSRFFNIPGGRLQEGAPADVVVINLTLPWKVDPNKFKSFSQNSAFIGWELPGRAVLTICAGHITFRLEGY